MGMGPFGGGQRMDDLVGEDHFGEGLGLYHVQEISEKCEGSKDVSVTHALKHP